MSEVIHNQHTVNILQTAKYNLQWAMQYSAHFSLQITVISFCSEGYFFVLFALIFTYLLQVQIPLFKRFSRVFYKYQKPTANSTLQTANANLYFYLSHQAQLHTAITPTTPFRGVGVVAVQCCALAVSVFHFKQLSVQ